MSTASSPVAPRSAVAYRFSTLATLDDADLAALEAAQRQARSYPARREILGEGQTLRQPLLIVDGWACRTHLLPDGRRQIVQVVLPGELVGNFSGGAVASPASLLALTRVTACPAPAASPGLALAYAASRDLEERQLLRQITRLGRMSAYERILDWLCELDDRLTLGGAVSVGASVSLTQEIIADALGLTSVHVNRTLRALRLDGLVQVDGRTITLLDRAACRTLSG